MKEIENQPARIIFAIGALLVGFPFFLLGAVVEIISQAFADGRRSMK